MTSEVLHSSSAPLELSAGESSGFLGLEAPDSVRTVTLRIVDLSADDISAAKPPRIQLRADAGPPVTVTEFPDEQPIADPEGHVAGTATWMRKNIHTYLLRVSLDRPGSGWDLQVVNEDSNAHTFQFVSLGSTRIRDDNWSENPSYCGAFPCACTSHPCGGVKCSRCHHSAECG